MDWILIFAIITAILVLFLAFWIVRIDTKLDKILWLLHFNSGRDDDE